MDFATVLSVVQTLLTAQQCSKLREICSILGYKSELDQLSDTVSAVKTVFLNAGAQQEISSEVQLWIQELKDMVYDADDLLDEFVTLAEQKQLKEGGKVSDEVRLFFSRFNLIDIAYDLSQGVKKIAENLDANAGYDDQFSLGLNFLAIRRSREETRAFVDADSVIGREDDVAKIVDMLVDSDAHQGVSFLSIVGTGGLGKTALARLVYDHKRVVNAFSLRLWTCVSDQDQQQFDVKRIFSKILRSRMQRKYDGPTDQMQETLMEEVAGSKFLLVLDDVWTENLDQWLKLAEFFMEGRRGSWIVVTTHSKETTKVIGNGPIYELQGLSEENSLSLFKRMAFGLANPPDDLVKIGKQIVKGCAGVPLAIRVVGSLLYGQGKSKWLSFQEIGLADIRSSKNNIVTLLKLSYHHLDSSLRGCFSYCVLFPKGFEIEKENLISLWVAQGYVVPLDESQSMEDAGEEYFSILLQRCFFQDVQIDEYGEIVSCKVHDLIHDIAKEIAGKEISAVNTVTSNLDKKVRHLSIMGSKYSANSFTTTHIRTYLQVDWVDQLSTAHLVENMTCLRALVLRDSGIESLPNSIDKLLHLRYLDLSDNSSLEVLPESITNLHNLQALILRTCIRLKELPKDLSKLVKLRVLDVAECYRLTSVPSDLGKLTSLHTLTMFPVRTSSSSKQCSDQLEGLKALKNLKGHLKICVEFPRNPEYIRKDRMEGSYLSSKNRLNHIRFCIELLERNARVSDEESLLEDLLPHSNLRGLVFFGYHCVRMPGWANNLATILPNLVRLELTSCQNLQYLPILHSLRHLKFLSVSDLPILEYMDASDPESSAREPLFFRCLEELYLCTLPNLKAWRKGEVVRDDLLVGGRSGRSKLSLVSPSFPCFPQLKVLRVADCPEMNSVLQCPRLEDLQLYRFNRKLQISMISKGGDKTWEATLPSCQSLSLSDARNLSLPKLRSLNTDNIVWYKSLPKEVFQCLTHICIYWDKELEDLSQVAEIIQSCSSSLLTLIICHCPKLRSLSKGLEHLTALETLAFENLTNLLISHEAEEGKDGMSWKSLNQSLRYLELKELSKLMDLPAGMQYLTNLRFLRILDCEKLQALPDWIRKLTSLRKLEVQGCSHDLYERWRNPDGEDWSNIQHIPHVSIY